MFGHRPDKASGLVQKLPKLYKLDDSGRLRIANLLPDFSYRLQSMERLLDCRMR
jgi:hypothetical protein